MQAGPGPHRLSRRDARRIAVPAQRLDARRPVDLLETIHDVLLLQVDPVSAIARSADLVLWSRIGSAYAPQELVDAIDEQGVVELRGTLRVAEDLALHRVVMADWPHVGDGDASDWRTASAQWLHDNNGCRTEILELLRTDGPLPTQALPDTCVRPWRSSGWNNNKNVPMLLDLMAARGDVAIAGRRGRTKLWDLADRVYPEAPDVDLAESRRLRDRLRLRSLGLARATGQDSRVEPVVVGDAGEPAVVEGVGGEWRVDPAYLDGEFTGRAALLSPFDRLVADRRRMAEIFGFDYTLEMYKPAAQRRWGYYALPILYDDRLVGKLDATAEPREGVLRVDAVHEDEPWSGTTRAAVDAEIDDLARWLDLEPMRT